MSSGCSHEDSENIEFIICFNQPATVKTGGFNQQKMAFNQHTGWGFRFGPTEPGVETNKHWVDSNSPSRNWGNHSGNPVSSSSQRWIPSVSIVVKARQARLNRLEPAICLVICSIFAYLHFLCAQVWPVDIENIPTTKPISIGYAPHDLHSWLVVYAE